MTDEISADMAAPFYQCRTKTAEPEMVFAVEPCAAPTCELFYVLTRVVDRDGYLYRWFRPAYIRQGGQVEFWAQRVEVVGE